jgi:colanic acid biosynthesis glycosyl transferase WcaI
MHFIIHSQYYPPEVGAPQTRLHELATGLQKQGFQVSVLTAMPSYPQGHIYHGYQRLLKEETIDGVQVIRTAIYPTHSTFFFPRIFSYFSFIFTSLLIGSWKISRADYLLTESPPLFLGLAGFILSRLKRARWIFNISDLWPESVAELGLIDRNSLSYILSSKLEKFLYHRAWLVTCQAQTILGNIKSRFPELRTYHLPNGVNSSFFSPKEIAQHDGFNIVYAGLHGIAQGLNQIILAANIMKGDESIKYTFVGDGPEKQRLMQLTKELMLTQIQFLDPISKNEMPSFLNTADAIIVPLKIQLIGAVPSKLYEAMSMEKPVILIAESEAAQIVKNANCGVIVKPGDIDGLVHAITSLKRDPAACKEMGINGRRVAIEKHDRNQIVNRFADYLVNAGN